MSSVHINNSSGFGLSIVDVTGNVSINHSTFYQNPSFNGYGGGVYLTVANSEVTLNNCTFHENKAVFHHPQPTHTAQGGGLYVEYKNHSMYGIVYIEHCQFTNNEAEWGGGILALFNKSAQNNKLVIKASNFKNNCANRDSYNVNMAGGGIGIIYVQMQPQTTFTLITVISLEIWLHGVEG